MTDAVRLLLIVSALSLVSSTIYTMYCVTRALRGGESIVAERDRLEREREGARYAQPASRV